MKRIIDGSRYSSTRYVIIEVMNENTGNWEEKERIVNVSQVIHFKNKVIIRYNLEYSNEELIIEL